MNRRRDPAFYASERQAPMVALSYGGEYNLLRIRRDDGATELWTDGGVFGSPEG